jgi:hypothetical protein
MPLHYVVLLTLTKSLEYGRWLKLSKLLASMSSNIHKEFVRTLAVWWTDDE